MENSFDVLYSILGYLVNDDSCCSFLRISDAFSPIIKLGILIRLLQNQSLDITLLDGVGYVQAEVSVLLR